MTDSCESDLWVSLGGDPAHPGWKPPGGRLLLTITSGCGGRVAQVYQEPTFPMAVIKGHTLTRAHTNMVIFDQALLDVEACLGMGDDGSAVREAIGRLLALLQVDSVRLPRLRVPESRVDVRTLAGQIERERQGAVESGYVPREFSGLSTACPKCKRMLYIGDDLAGWWAAGPLARHVVARSAPRLARNAGWSFADSRLADRLETYRRIVALLESP